MNRIEELDLSEIRRSLLKTQQVLLKRIQQDAVDNQAEKPSNPGTSDLAGRYDNDQRKQLLLLRAEQQLEEVESALERLDKCEYGICINCGQPIHLDRLRALPAGAYCIRCKQNIE
jgi:DnaK suppressor protein